MFFVVVLLGAYSIFQSNILYGIEYVVLLIIASFIMVYSYCAKCNSCSTKCAHPQFGYLRRFLPKRQAVKYKIKDYLGVAVFGLIASVLPQYWLWQIKWLFSTYWIILLVVSFAIINSLCPKCENIYCMMNRKK